VSRFRQKATAGLCTFGEPRWRGRQVRFGLGAGWSGADVSRPQFRRAI